MRYLIIIMLFTGSLKAQDSMTNVQAAGVKLRQSITCQIAAGGITALGFVAASQGKSYADLFFIGAGMLQIVSVSLHYQASELLIRPNGIVYKF